jgi:large subunit ribosomal protein L7/L12
MMSETGKGVQKKAATRKRVLKEGEASSTEETTGAPSEEVAEGTADMSNVDKVINLLEGMTILEVDDLVKKLEEKFGVTAAMPMAFAAAAAPGMAQAAQAPVEEEQTEFDVILNSSGEKKIQVIKVVRAITGLGLKEAKDLVDGAPKPVKEKVNKNEAQDIRTKLEEVGAVVEIK